MIKLLLNATEASTALSISISTLYRLTSSGEIKKLKVSPKRSAWAATELNAYVSSLQSNP
jgi:predicted DNA-binding transcriptional regulator AlpA